MTTILAGNVIRVTTTFTALAGHGDLTGTTAAASVTDPAGTSTSLTPSVSIGTDDVTVTVDWEIPDTQAAGSYVVTIDTDGPFVAASQTTITVLGRVDPAVA